MVAEGGSTTGITRNIDEDYKKHLCCEERLYCFDSLIVNVRYE